MLEILRGCCCISLQMTNVLILRGEGGGGGRRSGERVVDAVSSTNVNFLMYDLLKSWSNTSCDVRNGFARRSRHKKNTCQKDEM